MKRSAEVNWREIVWLAAVVFALSFLAFLASNWLRTDAAGERVAALGAFGPLVIVVYMTVSHVFVPLSGTPGIVVALSVYGPVIGYAYVYLASILSAVINFYIARRLGRVWVVRLAGRDSVAKIDKFVGVMGTRLLVGARLFGFPLYEFVSYAAGFTSISFFKYMAITILVSPISGIMFALLTYRALSSPWLIAGLMAGLVAIGGVFMWYIAWVYSRSEK